MYGEHIVGDHHQEYTRTEKLHAGTRTHGSEYRAERAMHRNAEKIRRENAYTAEIDEFLLIQKHRRSPEEKKDRDRGEENAKRNALVPHKQDLIEQQTEIADAEADAAADKVPKQENIAEKREKEADRQDYPHAEQRRVQQVRAHGVNLKEHGEHDLVHSAALEIAARLRKEVETKHQQICYDEYTSKINHDKSSFPSEHSAEKRWSVFIIPYPEQKGNGNLTAKRRKIGVCAH